MVKLPLRLRRLLNEFGLALVASFILCVFAFWHKHGRLPANPEILEEAIFVVVLALVLCMKYRIIMSFDAMLSQNWAVGKEWSRRERERAWHRAKMERLNATRQRRLDEIRREMRAKYGPPGNERRAARRKAETSED